MCMILCVWLLIPVIGLLSAPSLVDQRKLYRTPQSPYRSSRKRLLNATGRMYLYVHLVLFLTILKRRWFHLFVTFVAHKRYINLSRCIPTALDWYGNPLKSRLLSPVSAMGHPAICLSVVVIEKSHLVDGINFKTQEDKAKGTLSYRRAVWASPLAIEGERLMSVLGIAHEKRAVHGRGGMRSARHGWISFETKSGKSTLCSFSDALIAFNSSILVSFRIWSWIRWSQSTCCRRGRWWFYFCNGNYIVSVQCCSDLTVNTTETASKACVYQCSTARGQSSRYWDYFTGVRGWWYVYRLIWYIIQLLIFWPIVAVLDMTGPGLLDNVPSMLERDSLKQFSRWPHPNPHKHAVCLIAYTISTYGTDPVRTNFNLLWIGVLIGDRTRGG